MHGARLRTYAIILNRRVLKERSLLWYRELRTLLSFFTTLIQKILVPENLYKLKNISGIKRSYFWSQHVLICPIHECTDQEDTLWRNRII